MPFFPDLLKGLQGSQLQSRVKMEPADYLRVSIILVTLVLSCSELRIGCVKTKLTHITEAIQQSICSLRVFYYVPLIFHFSQCFWCGFNSKFWQREGLTSAVPNAIFTWLSKMQLFVPRLKIPALKKVKDSPWEHLQHSSIYLRSSFYLKLSSNLMLIWISDFHGPIYV